MIDEGVTKFDLIFTNASPPSRETISELVAWRTILWRLGLIGQDPARYGGVGFGNVSQRRSAGDDTFLISATQTGALPLLDAQHFAVVTACEPERNRVEAHGALPPSSESLTHGMIYRLDPSVRFVFHVHSPDIWQGAEALELPRTAANVAYGTPAMAEEMRRLRRDGAFDRSPILVMGGHEDGVIAFGNKAEAAATALIGALAAALARLRE